MSPHARLAATLRALHERRITDPLAGLGIVAAVEVDDHQPALAYHPPLEFAELPDTHHTRPRSLIDRYGDSGATCQRAMDRLISAGLRRGSQS